MRGVPRVGGRLTAILLAALLAPLVEAAPEECAQDETAILSTPAGSITAGTVSCSWTYEEDPPGTLGRDARYARVDAAETSVKLSASKWTWSGGSPQEGGRDTEREIGASLAGHGLTARASAGSAEAASWSPGRENCRWGATAVGAIGIATQGFGERATVLLLECEGAHRVDRALIP